MKLYTVMITLQGFLKVFGSHWLLFHCIAIATAVPSIWIDIRRMEIPDWITASGSAIAIGLCLGLMPSTLLPRLVVSGSVFLFLYAFSLIMKGNFGLGDVKFLSFASFCIGPIGLWACLTAASLIGIVFALGGRVARRIRTDQPQASLRIPFMPFIAAGLIVSLLLNCFGFWENI